MKKFLLVQFMISIFIAAGAGTSLAQVTLPQAIITGSATTTAPTATDPGDLTINATISSVIYLDETVETSSAQDSIIGKEIVILGASRTGSSSFHDALVEIRDPSNPTTLWYFKASLTNIMFSQIGILWYLNIDLNGTNPDTLNLEGVNLNEPTPSRFISELQSVLPVSQRLGMKFSLLFFSGNISGNGTADIGDGVLDGSPPQVEPPAGARTIGYWKNHDEEREAYLYAAASTCYDVYSNGVADVPISPDVMNTLRDDLSRKGKKDMIEKARQQLAALCLNVEASLDPSTPLETEECNILNMINGTTCPGPTVDDAVTAIINAINDGVAGNDEDAKDLADEINNRDNS